MTDKIDDTGADHLLVKRGLYYRPNGNGYTGRKDHAGLYPASRAYPDGGVTAIPFDEAPLFSRACHEEAKLDYYEERSAALQAKHDALQAENEALREALGEAREDVCEAIRSHGSSGNPDWKQESEARLARIDALLEKKP